MTTKCRLYFGENRVVAVPDRRTYIVPKDQIVGTTCNGLYTIIEVELPFYKMQNGLFEMRRFLLPTRSIKTKKE